MHNTTDASPLELAAREDLVERLERARELIRGDLAANAHACRALLEDIAQRMAARELTHDLELARDTGEPSVSRLSRLILAGAGGQPVTEFLLVPYGEVRVERPLSGGSFVFSERHARSAKSWFDQMGRKLAIDYEHQTFDRHNTRDDGLRPAAGWIGALELRQDGLWATQVDWTDRARALLRSGEYRYFSPVIYWTDEDQTDVAALGPVALTNDPAMRGVQPLAAACDAESADAEGDADVGGASGESGALVAAREEIATLRDKLAAQEADTFVERGLRQGKVLESNSMDWREDYLRDPQAAEARLARAPVVLPPGRVVSARRGGAADPEAARWKSFGIDSEDLAAYERAAASGRVR
ncbi:MAG: phage protease [Phycisphaerae bacterium]